MRRVTTCHLSGLNYAYGGAIYATGNVTMARSRVVDGVVEVDTLPARAGGGLIASAGLNADHSFLAGGVANAAYASRARGGGLYLNGPLHLSYSTVTSNAAVPGTGGAMFVIGDVDIRSSTFSSNSASFGAAMSLFRNFAAPTAAAITDSTISGNFIDDTGSAVESSIALTVSNSTIAFNTAYGEYTTPGAGILAAPGVPTVLQSTIIANNVAAGAPSDFTSTDLFNLSGSNNLIMVATGAQPEGTISDDPLLAPLASNGGATQTHALLDGSRQSMRATTQLRSTSTSVVPALHASSTSLPTSVHSNPATICYLPTASTDRTAMRTATLRNTLLAAAVMQALSVSTRADAGDVSLNLVTTAAVDNGDPQQCGCVFRRDCASRRDHQSLLYGHERRRRDI